MEFYNTVKTFIAQMLTNVMVHTAVRRPVSILRGRTSAAVVLDLSLQVTNEAVLVSSVAGHYILAA